MPVIRVLIAAVVATASSAVLAGPASAKSVGPCYPGGPNCTFVTGKVTTYAPDARAFLALAVGTSPLDARIVQNNMLPVNEPQPVTSAKRRIELPSVAVDVPAGQSLFLVITPLADMFASHGSRVSALM